MVAKGKKKYKTNSQTTENSVGNDENERIIVAIFSLVAVILQ